MTPAAATPGTRQRIVDAAMHLFWQNGYAATGVAAILERACVRSGSFYHFFVGKEDLLLAVLDTYVHGLDPVVVRPVFARGEDPIERIFGILAFYRDNLIRTGCTYGCPIGRLALEIDGDRHAVHRRIADNFTGWTAAIERCLTDAGERLPADLDRHALAQFVLTVMEGGVMQSRAHRKIEPFDNSVHQLREHFRLLATSTTRTPHPRHRAGKGRTRS